jgi:ribosome-binding protein aMBF1 (putative translation factor)
MQYNSFMPPGIPQSGPALRKFRRKEGLTRKQLAHYLGYRKSVWRSIERSG